MKFTTYVKIRNEKFGAVIFDTLNEKVFVTNESGKEILQLLTEGLEPSVIVEKLQTSHCQDASTIQADVAEFTGGLEAAGLLVATTEDA